MPGDGDVFTTESLLKLASALKESATDYESWRSRADILVLAVKKLERREIEADSNVKLIGVPLVQSELRAAAEKALRHCAHFAGTFDERISLVDHANDIRNVSWF